MNLYVIYDYRNESVVASNFMKNDFVAMDTFENAINSMIIKNKEIEEKSGRKNNLHLDSFKLLKTSFNDSVLFNSSDVLSCGSDYE